MGHQLIRQDDGRWAVFNSVVDCLTTVDMEPMDVVRYYGLDHVKAAAWVREMRAGRNPQSGPCEMSIREALAWTWHGNNPCRKREQAPDPSDPLESSIKACRTMPWKRTRMALDELIAANVVSTPFRRSRPRRGELERRRNRRARAEG